MWQTSGSLRLAQQAYNARQTLERHSTQQLRDLVGELKAKTGRQPANHISSVAIMAEAIRRTLGLTPHLVQLQGALAVVAGRIAEMQTGEGKTLVAGLAAFAAALSGGGVHIATTNTYLAKRDYLELKPAIELLGCTSGLLPEDNDFRPAKLAYQCDITYGTGYQFGFDYLRDQLLLANSATAALGAELRKKLSPYQAEPELRQRPPCWAIVDEADSVLIDEAVTPLLLAGRPWGRDDVRAYQLANHITQGWQEGSDFRRNVTTGELELGAEAVDQAHAMLRRQPHLGIVRSWTQYLRQALQARLTMHRDGHYVVRNDEICIVDRGTGRIFEDRSWRDGLHQAVQAKEGVTLKPSETTLTQITRQRCFLRYPKLGGLTGTGWDARHEFRQVYRCDVEVIPPHQPCRRVRLPHRFFASQEVKLVAIADAVTQRQQLGQPVLIGTRTIASTRELSRHLDAGGLPHVVLNGVQDEEEATLVAQAGRPGRVTIATNMAGRGTDFRLPQQSLAAGGLHVLGAEPNESIRIDRQLMGRSGRQGQPGSCQFFVSSDDEVLVKHGQALARRLRSLGATGVSQADLERSLTGLQMAWDRERAEQRSVMLQHDLQLDKLREILGSK